MRRAPHAPRTPHAPHAPRAPHAILISAHRRNSYLIILCFKPKISAGSPSPLDQRSDGDGTSTGNKSWKDPLTHGSSDHVLTKLEYFPPVQFASEDSVEFVVKYPWKPSKHSICTSVAMGPSSPPLETSPSKAGDISAVRSRSSIVAPDLAVKGANVAMGPNSPILVASPSKADDSSAVRIRSSILAPALVAVPNIIESTNKFSTLETLSNKVNLVTGDTQIDQDGDTIPFEYS
ncbi:hypothetical protein Acr_07g0005380 [Actinidia rufa]|uniref:Uncharacterized protein n=1 Tax=Actinidia rufa TaxID=165716 RepID=A0A7J0EV37_9ERIC|nr:hypothetical protein Acr_07g0005380 [Actinidia rufa]